MSTAALRQPLATTTTSRAIRRLSCATAIRHGADWRIARQVAHYTAALLATGSSAGWALERARHYTRVRLGQARWTEFQEAM